MIEKRVVVVTGGADGIGKSSVMHFTNKGDAVIIVDINQVAGKSAEEELLAKGADALFVKADVSKLEECRAVADAAMEKYGRIDVLFNNAGIVGSHFTILELEQRDLNEIIEINLYGTVYMTMVCAQEMKKLNKGVIINVCSVHGILAGLDNIAYSASKGGVKMVTAVAARELSPYGIRVVGIAPAWVETPIYASKTDEISMAIKKKGAELHMSNKLITTQQIANVVYLLSTDEASVINGSIVQTDDGYLSYKIPDLTGMF
jgi:NAD(P)-dependent dehydrogenase (short-subunit alcohol dehydrogenase family)